MTGGAGGNGLPARALLLNATYEPLAVVSWQRAIIMAYLGKVEVVENYDCAIHSVRQSWDLPSVIRLIRFVRQRFQPIKFCRDNVYLRDGYACQYCGRRFFTRELTWDHVVPRSQGGLTGWTNIVTACLRCNGLKGGRTPDQAAMQLIRKPQRPTLPHSLRLVMNCTAAPETWQPYLFQSSPQSAGCAGGE